MTRAIGLSLLVGVLLIAAGCRNSCCKHRLFARNEPAPQPAYVPPPPPAPLLPGPASAPPSGAFPVVPSGAIVPAPPGSPPPPSTSKSPERTDTPWLPGQTPEPEPRREGSSGIQLYAPEPVDKNEPKPAADTLSEKKLGELESFPAIAQFAIAQKNVYAGLRPSLEGLDWLKRKGVPTVIQIRMPGSDDAADRKQVELRGLRYVAFEVSPQNLTKEKVDEFVKLVRDGAQTGVFIYDEDVALAGAMWYLHMRYGEFLEDGAAQLRARQLGLRIGDGLHAEMWLAVQRVLSENNR